MKFPQIPFIFFLSSSQFYPTTGRDELEDDKDQLYEEGIEIDRKADWSKARQNIELKYQSIFAPGYDETEIQAEKLNEKLSYWCDSIGVDFVA